MKHVAILGAGICGRTQALMLQRLARQQQIALHITIIDEQGVVPASLMRGPSAIAAGMLAPYSEVASADPELFQLAKRGLTVWPEWIRYLGAEELFTASGTVVVAHPRDNAELSRFRRKLSAVMPDCTDVSLHTSDVLKDNSSVKDVCGFEQGLYIPDEAYVNVPALVTHMADMLHRDSNVCCERGRVKEVNLPQAAVLIGDIRRRFDAMFDCRGLGARPEQPELRGIRGELIVLHAPGVRLRHMVRLMHPRYCLYLVPRPDDHYVLGATQIESQDYAPVTVRSALELLSAAYALHEGFAEANIISLSSQCRPAFSDNMPRIQLKGKGISVNGLYRHGFLLSPLLAEQAARKLLALLTDNQFTSSTECVAL